MQQTKETNTPRAQERSAPKGEHEGRLAFLFDLDGTLVDSVYRHIQAWQEALMQKGVVVPAWRIHRRIGLSGAKLVRALLRELGREMESDEIKQVEKLHGEVYGRLSADVKPLPGARELLDELTRLQRLWAIVTSSEPEKAQPSLKMLDIKSQDTVVTRGEVRRAKPEPDPFYVGVSIHDCVVIGDSVWDLLSAQRARALGVGLLTGGYGREELERAGAYRVYETPEDMLRHLDDFDVNPD
jgi:phosphoglycolate phosphatase-like HAD superfamily hydrolase